jgi:hypothetical protein
MPLVTRTPLALEMGHRDLPNRVCLDEGCRKFSGDCFWNPELHLEAGAQRILAGVSCVPSRNPFSPHLEWLSDLTERP